MNLRAQLFNRITFHNQSGPDVFSHGEQPLALHLAVSGWQGVDERRTADEKNQAARDREDEMLGKWGQTERAFEVLKGLTLFKIEQQQEDEILFHAFDTKDGAKTRRFKMWYEPDCCAECSIEDITGDFADLIGTPILMAEEVTSQDHPEGGIDKDSETWTFYKLATIKGSVTIRWYGSSNGYYSEEASFAEFRRDDV